MESGNYVLDGISIISGSIQFVGSDQVMYDDNQTGIRERLNIFNTGNYAASPFSEITLENTQIFFNGQKKLFKILSNHENSSEIKLVVDVDPISFN